MKRTLLKRWIAGTVIVIGVIIIGVVIYQNKFSADVATDCKPVITGALMTAPNSLNIATISFSFTPNYRPACSTNTLWTISTPHYVNGKVPVDSLQFPTSANGTAVTTIDNWSGRFSVTTSTNSQKLIVVTVNLTAPTSTTRLPNSLDFSFISANGTSSGTIGVPVTVSLSGGTAAACDNTLTVTPNRMVVDTWDIVGGQSPTNLPTKSKIISLSVSQKQATCVTNQYQISLEQYDHPTLGSVLDNRITIYSISNSFVTDTSGTRITTIQLTGNQPKNILINAGVPGMAVYDNCDNMNLQIGLFHTVFRFANRTAGYSDVIEQAHYFTCAGGGSNGGVGGGTSTGTGGNTTSNVTVAPTVSLSAPVRYSNTSTMQSIQIKNNDTANNLKVTGVSVVPSRSVPSTLINALYGAQIKVGTSLTPALPFTVPSGTSNTWLAQSGTPPYPNPQTITTPVNPQTNYFVSSMLQGGLNTMSYAYSFCVQVTYNGTGTPVTGCYTNPGTPVVAATPTPTAAPTTICNLPTVTASPLSVSAAINSGRLVTYTFTPVTSGGKSPCNTFYMRFNDSRTPKVPTSFVAFTNTTLASSQNPPGYTQGQIRVTNPSLVSSTTILFNNNNSNLFGLHSIYSILMQTVGTGSANGPTVTFTAN